MQILGYVLAFFGSLAVDCIPVFAPPAWMLMLLVMAKFEMNPWVTAVIGNLGTASGRYIYSTFIVPWVGKKFLSDDKTKDLNFIGSKLSGRPTPVFIFVFLYALSPLSTTALFTAVGLANVKKRHVIPPFFLGHAIGDGLILASGNYAINNFSDMYGDAFTLKGLLMMGGGLAIMLFVIFVDWRELLGKKKLKFHFKFWK